MSLLSTVKFAAKQKKGHSMILVKARHVTNTLNEVDACSWWVGRVQAMRWRNGNNVGY